jgi:transposase-like protein
MTYSLACKKCAEAKNICRSGVKNLAQRYKCLSCNSTFARIDGRSKIGRHLKRLAAFFTYDEIELPFNEIVSLFGVKEKTMTRWLERVIKDFAINAAYRSKMTELRDDNEYYSMARRILNKHGNYYELRRIKKEKEYEARIREKIRQEELMREKEVLRKKRLKEERIAKELMNEKEKINDKSKMNQFSESSLANKVNSSEWIGVSARDILELLSGKKSDFEIEMMRDEMFGRMTRSSQEIMSDLMKERMLSKDSVLRLK